jgi:hypothetical protein
VSHTNQALIIILLGFFSFIFGSCSKPDAPITPPPRSDATAKADGEKLLASLLPFAEQMLQQHREFFPFGGHMSPDGTITHEGAENGTDRPPSQELIDLLRQAHQWNAAAQKIRACATIYDIRTIPPGRTEKQDAIAAAIDHVSGYSAVVIFPYSFDASQKLQIESPFAVEGTHDVFPRPKKTVP